MVNKNPIFTADKIFRHGDKLRAWLDGENPFPITVEIDPCGACNSHCPRCVGGEKRGMLPVGATVCLLHELANGGTRGVIFTGGGEPTLHPQLPLFLEVASGLGMDVGLITNGLRLTEELRSAIAKHATWVRVSLDAANPEDYARSHGGTRDEFEQVVENVRLLSTEPKCETVGVGILVENENLGSMKQAVVLCRETGADYVQFRPYYYGWYGDESEGLDVERYFREFHQAKRIGQNGFLVLHSEAKFEKLLLGDTERHYSFCWGQQFCGVVTAVGDVALCCLLRGNPRFVLGNILLTSFAEIWNGERRQEVLLNLDMSRDCPPLCRCDHINATLEKYRQENPKHENFL